MKFPFKSRKADIVGFLTLFLFSLSLVLLSEEAKIRTARAAIRASFSPIQKALTWVARPFRVYSENELLRRELTELSLESQLLRECAEENKRLRTLLEFKEKMDYKIEPAEVIGKDPGRLPATLVIGKGERERITVNLPCITHRGLVGKVVEVSSATALVHTIFDPDLRVACLLQRSRVLGILRFRGRGCVLENVLLDSDVRTGDEIVSSGMGGIFPKGLRVGRVTEVGSEEKGLFRRVSVEPSINLSKIEEVFVILREEQKPLLLEEVLPVTERPPIPEEVTETEDPPSQPPGSAFRLKATERSVRTGIEGPSLPQPDSPDK